MLNLMQYVVFVGIMMLAIYERLPIFSVACLYTAGIVVLEEILSWRFKNPSLQQFFSADIRELEEYEVIHLHKPQTNKMSRFARYVVLVVMLGLAYALRDYGRAWATHFNYVISFTFMVYIALEIFSNGMAQDRKLDRSARQQGLIPVANTNPIEMDLGKLKYARGLNPVFLVMTLAFFITLYFFLAKWIKSDAAVFMTGALLFLVPMLTYLFTRRLNLYSFLIPRIREYTEWRRIELGDDWDWLQKWGFAVFSVGFVALLVYAYLNIGSHDWVNAVHGADWGDVFPGYLGAAMAGSMFYTFGYRLDRALLSDAGREWYE